MKPTEKSRSIITKNDEITDQYNNLVNELLLLKSFVQKTENIDNVSSEELQINFDKALSLHDSFKELRLLKRMLEADMTSIELLESKTNLLLRIYLENFARDSLDLIASGALDVTKLFKWETSILWDCFEGESTYSKYQFSSSIINYCKNITFTDDLFHQNITPENDTTATVYKSVVETPQKKFSNFDSNYPSLADLIEKWKILVQEKKYIPKEEYCKNTADLQSIYNLFAIFTLFDENLITINDDLGVEWNDHIRC
ncbi:MAG: hypothetical protein ACFFD4_36915 [Candidatus Odinarchaeota archaeon]